MANVFFDGKIVFSGKETMKIFSYTPMGSLAHSVAEELQAELYDNGGQDGWFHVAHAGVNEKGELFAIAIFHIDDSVYEDGETPQDTLAKTFGYVYGEEATIHINPILQFTN